MFLSVALVNRPLLIGLLLLVPALGLATPGEAAAVADVHIAERQELREVFRGYLINRLTEEYFVITDTGTWESFWIAHAGPVPPEVDFEQEMVLVAVLQYPGANCNFRIHTVFETSAVENVTNALLFGTLPEVATGCSPDARYGAHMVAVPRLDGTVVFHSEIGTPLAITST